MIRKPIVTIVGRPNVGKSTLYNRLTGTRHALVSNQPGVTRDRREGSAEIADLEFSLIDTAGLEEASDESLEQRMTNQTLKGIAQADVVLMMVDARSGILPDDAHFGSLVRESGKPVILLVNKAEGRGAAGAAEAFSLGLGEPIAISSEHGEGISVLYDALLEEFKKLELAEQTEIIDIDHTEEVTEEDGVKDHSKDSVTIAVVGRPNVGKSTFLNQLLKEDRLLTGPEAGITRDAITVPFEYKGRELQLVDTAGMRRKSKVRPHELEVMAVNDTRRAIQYAHVVILMLDATQALERQDLAIASMLADEGRACILALNKWDCVEDPDAVRDEVLWQIDKVMPNFRGMPVVTMSALKGKSVNKALDASLEAYTKWNIRVPTGELNRWLEMVLEQHTPPLVKGRRLKIKYITQAKTRPPSFALFINSKDGVPAHYKRYLINSLRETFHLPGIPIRLLVRRSKNPYNKE